MRRYLELCKGMPPYTTFPFEKNRPTWHNHRRSLTSDYLTLYLAELQPAGSRVALAGKKGRTGAFRSACYKVQSMNSHVRGSAMQLFRTLHLQLVLVADR